MAWPHVCRWGMVARGGAPPPSLLDFKNEKLENLRNSLNVSFLIHLFFCIKFKSLELPKQNAQIHF